MASLIRAIAVDDDGMLTRTDRLAPDVLAAIREALMVLRVSSQRRDA